MVTAAAQAKAEAEAARRDAEAAREDAARTKAEAMALRTAKAGSQEQLAKTNAEAAQARSEAEAAKADAARARAEVKAMKAERAVAFAQGKPEPVATKPEPARSVSIQDGAPLGDSGRARIASVGFSGKNGLADITLQLPPGTRIYEGNHTRTRAQLIVDGVDVDARLEKKSDMTNYGSPVRTLTTYRDPHVANRVVIVVELLVPSTTKLERKGNDVRWRVTEDDIW